MICIQYAMHTLIAYILGLTVKLLKKTKTILSNYMERVQKTVILHFNKTSYNQIQRLVPQNVFKLILANRMFFLRYLSMIKKNYINL